MKATVTIGIPIYGSRSMFDVELRNGSIIATSKKDSLLIEGDHKAFGVCRVWLHPHMIQKRIITASNTTYLVSRYNQDSLNYFQPLKKRRNNVT